MTGIGYDVHRFSESRPLVLGGVKIEHCHGLEGHSDADVLCHAIADALLGAMGLPDIGFYFPDTSGEFKNIDSTILLRRVMDLLKERNYSVGNVDASLILERPKIKPHIDAMRTILSAIMEIEEEDIAIKATTNEKMGYVGREEGVAAYAVALINKP